MPASPRDIEKLISELHKDALPQLLACIVKHCVHKQVFKNRNLHEIVKTLEGNVKGKKLPK